MTSTDTIYALSTGIARAGVAVFRTSGPQARDGVAVLAASVPPPRQASLRRIRDPASGEIIDEGLVLWFPGPGSFTGEDMAEFHLHGSRAVADGMVGALGRLPGHRLAEPGEFTRRALANGRTDLVAVEGLSDLLMATSAAQRRLALFHMEGDASRVFYAGWRGDLVGCLARVEAAIDFAEEDQVGALGLAGVAEALDRLAGSLAGALAAAAAGESLREGFRVVIAGPPNVGKSCADQRLAGREAAIVTDIPGTTRDPIDVALELDGLALVVTDTAGLRPGTADPIERDRHGPNAGTVAGGRPGDSGCRRMMSMSVAIRRSIWSRYGCGTRSMSGRCRIRRRRARSRSRQRRARGSTGCSAGCAGAWRDGSARSRR